MLQLPYLAACRIIEGYVCNEGCIDPCPLWWLNTYMLTSFHWLCLPVHRENKERPVPLVTPALVDHL